MDRDPDYARSPGFVRFHLLGLLVGGLNASLVTTVAFLESGNLGAMSWALLGQAFSLPVLFGVLSQAIAYRHASRRLQTRFVTQFVKRDRQ
jgi:hypothetical protein